MKMNRVSNPTNVRFDDETLLEIESLARALCVNKSDLIRFAVVQKLPEWRAGGVYLKPRMRRVSHLIGGRK